MDSRRTETGEDQPVAGTPEDVAILYAWANLHGAKYRDFSASRREYRAQIRYRAAQSLRDKELQAQAQAEVSAAAAERAALAAESAARSQGATESQVIRLQALRNSEASARKAAAERVEATRRGEAAARASAVAEREEREIAEAHASSQRQAAAYTESEVRRRQLAGPQPRTPLPGEISDPYTSVSTALQAAHDGGERPESRRDFLSSSRYSVDGTRTDISRSSLNLSREVSLLPRPQGYMPDDASGVWQVDPSGGSAVAIAGESSGSVRAFRTEAQRETPGDTELQRYEMEKVGPAWLYSPQSTPAPRIAPPVLSVPSGTTLQDSKERVASRWFALKGVFEHAGPELPAMQPVRPGDARWPVLLVFSLAGGVGKTSLVATLGRALSSLGEKVILTDTTTQRLLPFYFGARELRTGVVRSFSAPVGSKDGPISMVGYEIEGKFDDARHQEILTDEILRNGQGNNRIVLDLSPSSAWLIRRMANLHPTILVPMSPDMNSVISMQAVEKFFESIADGDSRPVLPYYVLNQFDAALPLHLDVREVFRRQLGDRLLNFVIRRSPAVSEALAEGMTVVDYAPNAPVSKDYVNVATWLRTVSPPAMAGFRNLRGSGQ